ncbi:MAG TPA: hypothetical protein VGR28_10215 [Candidatus Thermoplasmatota archaeon]|nr:hypothetical protein [Candidatus Thermoplasmatota archaeon]
MRLCFLVLIAAFAMPSTALLTAAHPVHRVCEWNSPNHYDIWMDEYLDQLLSENPEQIIDPEADPTSGIVYWNSCYQADAMSEPRNVCNPLDTRTSETMIEDWGAAHAGLTVAVGVPELKDEIDDCWV